MNRRTSTAVLRPEPRVPAALADAELQHLEKVGYFKSGVANAAHEACGLKAEKSSMPAIRNSTVRMVLKLAYPRALRLAA